MCIQTIWIRKAHQEVPCGKCYECVKRRRNDWYIRCLFQYRETRYTYFGLLTYAKVGARLEKRDIQLFLKRLRAYGYRFRYIIVGEHGDKKDRPHWHCLIFSDEIMNYSLVSKAWHGGFKRPEKKNRSGWINFSPLRGPSGIRYVVKYIYKYDGLDPRFTLMVSKRPAIGSGFVTANQKYFLENRTTDFTLNGRPMAMPRYYKRKIFDGYEDIKEEINSVLAVKVAELAEKELEVARSFYPNMSDNEIKLNIKKSKYEFGEIEKMRG